LAEAVEMSRESRRAIKKVAVFMTVPHTLS
jgi:hypothetical protein